MSPSSNRSGLLAVILIALAVLLPNLFRPFSTRGEPREALVAQAMLATGNWISPAAYDGAVPSKPPLMHWLISIFSLPFDQVTELTARLPSIITALFFLFFFARFLMQRFSYSLAILSSLVLATSPEWIRAASSCRVDAVLSVALAAALLLLFSWNENRRKGVPLWAIFSLTCATLAKGPIGLLLPGAIFGVYVLCTESLSVRSFSRLCLSALCIAAPVILISSLWYFAAYQQRGDEFLSKVWYENFQRLAGSMEDEPHKHSAVYLWLLTMVGLLPWSLTPIAILLERRPLKSSAVCTHLKEMLSKLKWPVFKADLTTFCTVASILTLVFFSLPSSKRSVYVLPAYPFLAVLVAQVLQAISGKFLTNLAGKISSYSERGDVALLTGGLAIVLPIVFELPLIEALFSGVVVSCAVALIGYSAKLIRKEGIDSELLGNAVALSFILVTVTGVVIDPVMRTQSPKHWLQTSGLLEREDFQGEKELYSFGSENYAASFYLQKPFKRVVSTVPGNSFIFVEQRNVEKLKALSLFTGEFVEVRKFSSKFEDKKKSWVVLKTPSS